MRHQLAAYYFPNYHVDPRNESVHGAGWTEWELVRAARTRFPGHRPPPQPVWGEQDEADPAVMARKIGTAADHGLDAFIFDFYWHEDGPFLQRALEDGFMRAANRDRLGFGLMWANHDWTDIHPARRGVAPRLLHRGAVSRAAFEAMTDHVVARYFPHPSCWCPDGRPYFSIYELGSLVRGFGGVEACRDALAAFRAKVKAAGMDVHLNAVVWGVGLLPGEITLADSATLIRDLGFDSVGSYVWVHDTPPRRFPATPYGEVAKEAAARWAMTRRSFPLPFHPNVTMGWDASPRTAPGDDFVNEGYPFMPVLSGNTPEAFRAALLDARDYLDGAGLNPSILTINAWNEWTEGSYLEPDTVHGEAYLRAIRDTFR